MLLVDARGHGQSEGPFIASGGDYGLDEPHDVTGAVKYVHEHVSQAPTIVHGLCMGGRHATIALAQLSSIADPTTQRSLLATYNVKGFICDSAPNKASSLKKILALEVTNKMVPQWFKKIPGYKSLPKKEIQKTLLYRATASIASSLVNCVRYIWFDRNGIDYNEATGAILSQGKGAHIACPVFFIHATDDTYIGSCDSKEIAQEVCDKRELVYPAGKTEHVQNHTRHPAEYAQRCHDFIEYALAKPLPQQPMPPLPYQPTFRDFVAHESGWSIGI